MMRDTKVGFCASLGLHAAVLFGMGPDMFRPADWGMAYGEGTFQVELIEGAPAPAAPAAKPVAAPAKKTVAPIPPPTPEPEPVKPPEPETPLEPVAPVMEPVVTIPDHVQAAPASEPVTPTAEPVAAPSTPVSSVALTELTSLAMSAPTPPENVIVSQPAVASTSAGESPLPSTKGERGKGADEMDMVNLASPGVAWLKNVRYRRNTPPDYPVKAIIQKIEGLVYLVVDIDPAGRAVAVKIHRSSGSAMLDEAAVKAVWRWEFEPAVEDGKQVKSRTLIPVEFELMSRAAATKSRRPGE